MPKHKGEERNYPGGVERVRFGSGRNALTACRIVSKGVAPSRQAVSTAVRT